MTYDQRYTASPRQTLYHQNALSSKYEKVSLVYEMQILRTTQKQKSWAVSYPSRNFQSAEVSDNVPTSETNLLSTSEFLCLSVCLHHHKDQTIHDTSNYTTINPPNKKGGMETFPSLEPPTHPVTK